MNTRPRPAARVVTRPSDLAWRPGGGPALVQRMYERGATVEQIAAKFAVADGVIEKVLRGEGVTLRSRGRPGLRTDADTERALASAFLAGATIAECAARNPGVSCGQARDVLRELGLIS